MDKSRHVGGGFPQLPDAAMSMGSLRPEFFFGVVVGGPITTLVAANGSICDCALVVSYSEGRREKRGGNGAEPVFAPSMGVGGARI